jgi:hypothetical protein
MDFTGSSQMLPGLTTNPQIATPGELQSRWRNCDAGISREPPSDAADPAARICVTAFPGPACRTLVCHAPAIRPARRIGRREPPPGAADPAARDSASDAALRSVCGSFLAEQRLGEWRNCLGVPRQAADVGVDVVGFQIHLFRGLQIRLFLQQNELVVH